MKLAVIADIHGNLAALDAVLADIAGRDVDRVVNLGDVVSGPLWPRETAERLMQLGLTTIRGNHERQLLTEAPDEMGLTDRFTIERLGAAHLRWLETMPETLWLGGEVLLVHGTPSSDLDYFLETVEADGPRAALTCEIDQRAGAAAARLILCGHSHLQRQATTSDGRWIVNPGSVGLPAYRDDLPVPHSIEAGTPQARYAVVELGPTEVAVEFISIDYDWHHAADMAAANGRSDWARALRSGRV